MYGGEGADTFRLEIVGDGSGADTAEHGDDGDDVFHINVDGDDLAGLGSVMRGGEGNDTFNMTIGGRDTRGVLQGNGSGDYMEMHGDGGDDTFDIDILGIRSGNSMRVEGCDGNDSFSVDVQGRASGYDMTLVGGRGDDTFTADPGGVQSGSLIVDGGEGHDVVIYGGNRGDYSITINRSTGADGETVTEFMVRDPHDAGASDHPDRLVGVEVIRFDDGDFAPAPVAPVAAAGMEDYLFSSFG